MDRIDAGGASIDADLVDVGPDGAPGDASWPPNLLDDPGFENGDGDFVPYLGSTGRTTTNPHGGLRSLIVCKDDTGGASFVSVYHDVYNANATAVPVGAHFRAQAWVRAAPEAGPVAPSFLAPIVRERGGPSPFFNHLGAELSPVVGEWRLVSADGVITDGERTGLSFLLEGGDEADGTCFAVDDAYVGRFE